MSEIRESIETFKKLLDIEYEFVIAHKGKTVTLKLFFEKIVFYKTRKSTKKFLKLCKDAQI